MTWIRDGFLAMLALWLGATSAHATIITFDAANIAGYTFEYTYTVQNDTLAVDIEEFTIFFDVALFENLSAPSAPTGWNPIVIQPDSGLPDDGFYDALALVAGIAPGDTLNQFTVRADFLGAGSPGSQPFEILNPFTFTVLDSGFTVPASVLAVTEPGSIALMSVGLLVLAAAACRRTTGNSRGEARTTRPKPT